MSEEYYNGTEKKSVSFENWLKDERLDRQAGLTPTHPGHSVDSPSRWSGQGKGDVDKPVSQRFLDNYDQVFGKHKADPDLLRTKYRSGSKLYVVSTAGGVVEMDEKQYAKHKKNK
jgi:hypothetical protein